MAERGGISWERNLKAILVLQREKKKQKVSESPTNKDSVDIVRMQHP